MSDIDFAQLGRERTASAKQAFDTPPPLPVAPPEGCQTPQQEPAGLGAASSPAPGPVEPSGQTVSFDAPRPRTGENQDDYLARVGQVAQRIIDKAGCDVVTTTLPLEGLGWRPYWRRKWWRRSS